ncbi:MAG TPA: CdaR family protein [Herpetosiphonaceae bacterium]
MRRLRTSGLQFLLALMLSLALWTYVSFTENPTEQEAFEVPVTLIDPHEGLVLVDATTGEPAEPKILTTLQVTGPQLNLDELDTESFTATADLSTLEAGLHSVPIRVRWPSTVRVRSHNPASLQVRLVPEATRTMTVTRDVQGQLPFLFELEDISLATDQVVASGPQDLMARIERVSLPIDLQGRTANFTREIEPIALDENGDPVSGITLRPNRIKVNVQIESRVEVQRASVLPSFTGQPAPGYTTERIDWAPKFVEIIASQAITVALETEKIDLAGRTESFTQTVSVIKPTGIQTQLLTERITVTVPVVPFQVPSNVPLFVPVTPVNLGSDLAVTADPPTLTITVSGTFDQLSQLANATVQATVDLSGLGPGTYQRPAAIPLPQGLQIVGDQPQVTVTIAPSPPGQPSPAPTTNGG